MTCLIVNDDHAQLEEFARVLSPIVRVVCAATEREALNCLGKADILIVDWHLNGDTAEAVLDAWVSERGGPCCVVSDRLSQKRLQEFLTFGAYNALHWPFSLSVLTSVVRHYTQDVVIKRELTMVTEELRKMRRLLLLVCLLAVSLLGPSGVTKMIDWVTSL